MKNVKTYKGRILSIDRLPSSTNGNARFSVTIAADGNVTTVRTSVDSGWADNVKNLREGDLVTIEAGIHFGHLTIDSIERVI